MPTENREDCIVNSAKGPPTRNQAELERCKQRFISQTTYCRQLIRLLDTSGVQQWRFKPGADTGGPQWWINVTLPPNLQEMSNCFKARTRPSRSTSGKEPPALRLLDPEGKIRLDLINHLSLLWTSDLATLIDAAPSRIELFVDEIDQAFPEQSAQKQDAEGLFRTLVQIRGLIQAAPSSQKGIVLICAGMDPSLFEKPILPSGPDNLIHKLVRLLWLGPMERDEMRDMIGTLGKRMGVKIRGNEPTDLLFDEFGGHPFLTRQACPVVTRGRRPDDLPFYIDAKRVARAMDDPSMRKLAREHFDEFRRWFGEEARVLEYLWSDNDEDRVSGQERLAELPSGLEHAIAFGIAKEDGSARIAAAASAILDH